MAQKRKNDIRIVNPILYEKYKNGEISHRDYYREYIKEYRHKTGRNNSLSDNKNCPQYLGIHIAERILSKLFKDVKRMPLHNKGYDFICSRGFKIDVKSSTKRKGNKFSKGWVFNIERNKTADYFLLLAFDNRDDLNPLHLWFIKGDEFISKKVLNDTEKFEVGEFALEKVQKYELKEKLEQTIDCCNKLK